MARKTKNKQVIDGKLEEAVASKEMENITGGKKNVRSIDELLGVNKPVYSVGTFEEYELKLKNMTLADLQNHAASVGLLPVTNKAVLMGRLLKEYTKKARGFYNTSQFNAVQPKNVEQTLAAIKSSGY